MISSARWVPKLPGQGRLLYPMLPSGAGACLSGLLPQLRSLSPGGAAANRSICSARALLQDGDVALHNLIAKFCDMSGSEIDQFLYERGFPQSLAITTQVGNIYSGSVFLTLASLLSERSIHWKESLVERRVLICSYGSGNTMAIMGATVAPEALNVVAGWNGQTLLDNAVPQSFEEYSRWVDGTYDPGPSEQTTDTIPPGSFYLSAIRKDGYREYEYR